MGTPEVFIELEHMPFCPAVKTLTFTGNECRKFRFFLRLLSLWRPCSAGFLERILYPLLVNALLLVSGPVRNIIRANVAPHWISIESIYVIHEVGIWLGHILANIYFRTRDLETNVLPAVQLLTRSERPLKRRLRNLDTCMVIVLSLFSITLCTLFVVTKVLNINDDTDRFSSFFPYVHGTVDHVLCVVVMISMLYNLGVGLALAWTMGFLHACFACRLQALEGVFLRWKTPMQDAVYFYQRCYSRPLKRSWERVSWWFLAHNVIVLAMPLYGFKLAQAFGGVAYDVRHLSQFIVYLVFVFFTWLTPTVAAEKIQKNEAQFRDAINDFCPGLLEEDEEDVRGGDHDSPRVTRACARFSCAIRFKHREKNYGTLDSEGTRADCSEFKPAAAVPISSDPSEEEMNSGAGNYNDYTFTSRGDDLRMFLRFLRDKRPSMASHGYTWQLVGSFISIVLGILSFLVNLQRNHDIMLTG